MYICHMGLELVASVCTKADHKSMHTFATKISSIISRCDFLIDQFLVVNCTLIEVLY